MKKFELIKSEKIDWHGRILYRIRACRDFEAVTGYTIQEGDFGGFVEKESNLSHDGMAWIYGTAQVYGNANVI